MLNNVVLDVFIGLVLVFLLYSLLVTIIGEILATWMGLRSRILRVSIEKMLNDGYNQQNVQQNWWDRKWVFIQRYFLKQFSDFKESFAGRFYDYPAIKYLSNKAGEQTTAFSQTKPSYLTAEIFSDTLIQLIKDKGTGADDMEKVGYSLKYNTHHIQLATLKHLADMFDNSAGNIVLFKDKLKQWYNETQDRATGWYKRKLQLILFWLGFVIAIIFNVDTIRIARILSKDKEAREQLVEMGVQVAKDTARYPTLIIQNGDTLRSKQLLDKSYTTVKKDIDEANLVLGLGWKDNKFSFIGLLGIFITALMLSLGAPFWFDLLKKLVAIRGSGVKPEEKKDAPATIVTTGTGEVSQIPVPKQPALANPPETGLPLSIKKIKAELTTVKGILSVEAGFIIIESTKKPAVEVHVENTEAMQVVVARVGTSVNGYPINCFVITEPEAHALGNLSGGSRISNKVGANVGANGSGTLGCFIRKKNSDKVFLLSCWHVLKADHDWWSSLGQPDIIDSNNNVIARIADGTLSNTFDVGIALCIETLPFTRNVELNITKDWRTVTEADSVNEFKVHFQGTVSGPRTAVIYNHVVEKSLRYPDRKKYILTDLFSITIRDQGKLSSPSSKGDSGSVVVGDDGSPLGILIGGDDKFSYVAKFSNFLGEGQPYRDYSIEV